MPADHAASTTSRPRGPPPTPTRDPEVERVDGESDQAKDLVRRLRATLPASVVVGGNSASQLDFDDTVSGSMWKIALFVLALSYVVRSCRSARAARAEPGHD